MPWAAEVLQVGQGVMGEKVVEVVAGAKPDLHFHLSHWTKSWNLESQLHSCWTQIPPDLGAGSPHQSDTLALGPFPTGTPCADDGGSGDG